MNCRAWCVIAAIVLPLQARDAFLFASFRDNGQAGVHFAISSDAKRWVALNQDRPWIKPEFNGMLMRDPWLGQGPDGIWHLLWTCGWNRANKTEDLTIGHSTSRDLIHWSKQVRIPVMTNEPAARNAWAPEAVWDAAQKQWVIFFASTIPGRFPNTENSGDSSYNHRIYATRTRDWKTFSLAALYFDPGFNCIDSTVVPVGGRWLMVFKDERKNPLRKQLRTAVANSPEGPWTKVSDTFTDSWNEGPTVLRVGKWWWIYFDHYTQPQHYGAVRTSDWKTFEDESANVTFPPGQKHGTAVRISSVQANKLKHVDQP